MKVSVQMPDATFWALAAIAEKYDMKVPEYLMEIASSVSPNFTSDPVCVLWREGYTDKQIGARLSLTNEAVGRRRRKHHLPANRHLSVNDSMKGNDK